MDYQDLATKIMELIRDEFQDLSPTEWIAAVDIARAHLIGGSARRAREIQAKQRETEALMAAVSSGLKQ